MWQLRITVSKTLYLSRHKENIWIRTMHNQILYPRHNRPTVSNKEIDRERQLLGRTLPFRALMNRFKTACLDVIKGHYSKKTTQVPILLLRRELRIRRRDTWCHTMKVAIDTHKILHIVFISTQSLYCTWRHQLCISHTPYLHVEATHDQAKCTHGIVATSNRDTSVPVAQQKYLLMTSRKSLTGLVGILPLWWLYNHMELLCMNESNLKIPWQFTSSYNTL